MADATDGASTPTETDVVNDERYHLTMADAVKAYVETTLKAIPDGGDLPINLRRRIKGKVFKMALCDLVNKTSPNAETMKKEMSVHFETVKMIKPYVPAVSDFLRSYHDKFKEAKKA